MPTSRRFVVGDLVKVVLMGTAMDARIIADLGPLARDGKRILSVQLADPELADDPPRFDVLEEWLEQVQALVGAPQAQTLTR